MAKKGDAERAPDDNQQRRVNVKPNRQAERGRGQ